MEVPVSSRIKFAVEDAELAFWKEIAAAFPEARSGDFPPDLTHQMQAQMRTWVTHWVKYNTNLMPEVPDSPEWFAAITRHLADIGAELENTGGGILCIGVKVCKYYLLFGTANEDWGADIFIGEYCGDLEGSLNLENAPSDNEDTVACANYIRAAVEKFKAEHPE